jgi:hypothetical protein
LLNAKLIMLSLLLLSSAAGAAQPTGTFDLGGRIGIFSNSETQLASGVSDVKLYANKNNFYAEGSARYYFLPHVAAVANLGSFSKGDIRFEGYQVGVGYRTFFGSASIYPIQLGLRLSPVGQGLPLNLRPYAEGGGALIVGTESIDALYYDYFQDAFVDGNLATETDWNWWGGAGIEVPVSPKIYLDFMAKYINVNFSGDIAGISDYSGWQISIGFGYLILK